MCSWPRQYVCGFKECTNFLWSYFSLHPATAVRRCFSGCTYISMDLIYFSSGHVCVSVVSRIAQFIYGLILRAPGHVGVSVVFQYCTQFSLGLIYHAPGHVGVFGNFQEELNDIAQFNELCPFEALILVIFVYLSRQILHKIYIKI